MAEQGEQHENTYEQVDYEEVGPEDQLIQNEGGDDNNNDRNERRGVPHGVIPHVLFLSRFRQSTTTEEAIRKLLEPFGVVKNIVHKNTVAFCEFERAEDAFNAKHELHKKPGLDSDSLIVDFKKANTGVQNFNSEGNFMRKDEELRHRRDDRRSSRFEHGSDDRRRDHHDRNGRDNHRPDSRDHHRGDYNRRDAPPRDLPPRDLPPRDLPPRDLPPREPVYDRDDRFYGKSGPPPMDGYNPRVGGRGLPEHAPMPYPPQMAGYGRPMDDRRMPPAAYEGNHMYRGEGPRHEPRSRSPYGAPPANFDDRRQKRPFDAHGPPPMADYPRGGPPMRGPGPGPVDGRDFYPPYDGHAPGHVPPPMQGNPRSRGIEQSTYAANANRRGDFDDRGMGRPGMPPNVAAPPVRYDEPNQGRPPREYPPHPRGGFNDRPDYRGPPPEDYLAKRPRY